ncbi:MAG: DUF883 C-terminal domain-containing protein [Betaproteobacteria bacterium]
MTETNEMSGTVARTVDQATGSLHRAIDKASGAARPAVDRIAAGVHETVDNIAVSATRAAETLDVKSGQVRDAQARFTENCRVRIQEDPLASLGIAAAVGFLLGYLLRPR